MAKTDAFGARASLKTASGEVTIYRLSALSGLGDVDRMPHVVKIVLENVLRNAASHEAFETVARRDAGRLEARRRQVGRAAVPAGPGAAPGLHRRPGRRGHRGDALGDGAARRRSEEGQPPAAGRPRHRPLGPDRLLRHQPGLRRQRREGVRAEPRTVPAAALGAAGVQRHDRRAAGHGDLPSGQPRVPLQGGPDARASTARPSRSRTRWWGRTRTPRW